MQAAISSRRLRTISLSFGVRRKFLPFNCGTGAASSESGFPNTSGFLFAYQNAVRGFSAYISKNKTAALLPSLNLCAQTSRASGLRSNSGSLCKNGIGRDPLSRKTISAFLACHSGTCRSKSVFLIGRSSSRLCRTSVFSNRMP